MLHTIGAAWLGTLPDPSQLNQVARVEAGDQPGDASGGLEEHLTEQLKMAGDGELIQGLDGAICGQELLHLHKLQVPNSLFRDNGGKARCCQEVLWGVDTLWLPRITMGWILGG